MEVGNIVKRMSLYRLKKSKRTTIFCRQQGLRNLGRNWSLASAEKLQNIRRT